LLTSLETCKLVEPSWLKCISSRRSIVGAPHLSEAPVRSRRTTREWVSMSWPLHCFLIWGRPSRASSDRIRSGSTSYALVLNPPATRFEAAVTKPLPFGFDAAGGFRASAAVSPPSAIFSSAASGRHRSVKTHRHVVQQEKPHDDGKFSRHPSSDSASEQVVASEYPLLCRSPPRALGQQANAWAITPCTRSACGTARYAPRSRELFTAQARGVIAEA